ncbi:RDD family protein [Shimia sp. SK013]|uniref:RDD family protein n=1 Tax=Shimia sp. SK013 TaxID=1389006 RepID=UPI0006B4B31C|nr:RDD family protein [Shimia sp. SK013]KPA22900.1 RDD family protein [Shimia sp. SK013]
MSHRSFTLPDPEIQSEFYADVPLKRFLAWVVDSLLVVLLCILVLPLTAFTGIFFFGFLLLVVGFAYRTITLANGSATLGMRLVSIEMRRADGDRFDLGTAFLHTLGFHLSFAFFVVQIVSIVLMLTTNRAQGLTDHVLGTVAINRAARS